MRRDPGRLRIGFSTASPIGTDVPPGAVAAVRRTGLLGRLARLGLLDSTVARIARDNLRYVPFTQLSNLTGTPSMSVPLYWTADGLPLGVQFVAPFGAEDRLLQLAYQLEGAQPWFDRLPAMTRDDMPARAQAATAAAG